MKTQRMKDLTKVTLTVGQIKGLARMYAKVGYVTVATEMTGPEHAVFCRDCHDLMRYQQAVNIEVVSEADLERWMEALAPAPIEYLTKVEG